MWLGRVTVEILLVLTLSKSLSFPPRTDAYYLPLTENKASANKFEENCC